MLEEYIYHGKEKLRCGYTTGSCAAAASKAAVWMLLAGRELSRVKLMTPKGILLNLDVLDRCRTDEFASCATQKDSGDDPDVTNGIFVYAKAEKITEGFLVDGGIGVGRVTKEGLDQPVGAAAINRVPRQMIKDAAMEVCGEWGYTGGLKITISIPEGEALAKKTYNPRMGIVEGISVIGTTGIVEPMSSLALIETIRAEERMRRAQGRKSLLLTIGNYTESFLEAQFPGELQNGVKCSNFIGEAIDSACEFGFERILIIGHAGKLVKLGAGIMNTHSAQADGRMEILVTCGLLAGVKAQTLLQIPSCVTVDQALAILDKAGMREKTCEILMERIQFYLDAKVKNAVEIGACLFAGSYGIIGKTGNTDTLFQKMMEEERG